MNVTGILTKEPTLLQKVAYLRIADSDSTTLNVVIFNRCEGARKTAESLHKGDIVTVGGHIEQTKDGNQLIAEFVKPATNSEDAELAKIEAELEEVWTEYERLGHQWMNTAARFNPNGKERINRESKYWLSRIDQLTTKFVAAGGVLPEAPDSF